MTNSHNHTNLQPQGEDDLHYVSNIEGWSDDEDEDRAASGEADEEEEQSMAAAGPFFPDLIRRIEEGIASLGGSVFPKMNWTAPADAAWIMADKTLRCDSVGDVLLLLKSSDDISDDLTSALEEREDGEEARPVDFVLVLRAWSDLHPSSEFRCFVKDRQLVGVTQRQPHFYPHLCEDEMQQRLREELWFFYHDKVKDRFDEACTDYVFDVYVDRKFRVWLMGFKPAGRATQPILFDWEQAPLCRDGDGAAPVAAVAANPVEVVGDRNEEAAAEEYEKLDLRVCESNEQATEIPQVGPVRFGRRLRLSLLIAAAFQDACSS